jgi:hypothetical protein
MRNCFGREFCLTGRGGMFRARQRREAWKPGASQSRHGAGLMPPQVERHSSIAPKWAGANWPSDGWLLPPPPGRCCSRGANPGQRSCLAQPWASTLHAVGVAGSGAHTEIGGNTQGMVLQSRCHSSVVCRKSVSPLLPPCRGFAQYGANRGLSPPANGGQSLPDSGLRSIKAIYHTLHWQRQMAASSFPLNPRSPNQWG